MAFSLVLARQHTIWRGPFRFPLGFGNLDSGFCENLMGYGSENLIIKQKLEDAIDIRHLKKEKK